MSIPDPIATLELRGGHPALDFANTVSARRDRWGPDRLEGYGDLVAWAERVELIDLGTGGGLRRQAEEAPHRGREALARAKDLREALYRLFSAEAGGEEVPREDLALLRSETSAALRDREILAGEGGFAWGWRSGNDLDLITRRIAFAAAELLTSDRLGRVKECFGRNCGWLFLDTSRNGRRRWCSDQECGTPARVRRHRSRRREIRAEEVGPD